MPQHGRCCRTRDIGPQGAVAASGLPGAAGAAGPVGPQGSKGDIGSQGAKGDVGPQGPAGLAGATGPAGTTGQAASTVGLGFRLQPGVLSTVSMPSVTTTAATDAVVVTYNIVFSNNFAGACDVFTNAILDNVSGPGTQTQIPPLTYQTGFGQSSQTVVFNPGVGSHTLGIQAVTGCVNVGTAPGSAVTTLVIKR